VASLKKNNGNEERMPQYDKRGEKNTDVTIERFNWSGMGQIRPIPGGRNGQKREAGNESGLLWQQPPTAVGDGRLEPDEWYGNKSNDGGEERVS